MQGGSCAQRSKGHIETQRPCRASSPTADARDARMGGPISRLAHPPRDPCPSSRTDADFPSMATRARAVADRRKCASLATSSSTLCAKPERGMHHAFTPQLVRARGAGERRTCPLAPIGATSSPHRGCMLGDRDPRDKSYLVQENQTGEQTSHVRARAPLARAAAGRSAHRSGDGSPYSLLEVRCTAGGRAPASDRSLLKHCFQTPSASATLYRL